MRKMKQNPGRAAAYNLPAIPIPPAAVPLGRHSAATRNGQPLVVQVRRRTGSWRYEPRLDTMGLDAFAQRASGELLASAERARSARSRGGKG